MTLSEDDVDAIASKLAEKLAQPTPACHVFSQEDIVTLRSILKTKKTAAKLMLLMFGTFMLWILKDIYDWAVLHLTWSKP